MKKIFLLGKEHTDTQTINHSLFGDKSVIKNIIFDKTSSKANLNAIMNNPNISIGVNSIVKKYLQIKNPMITGGIKTKNCTYFISSQSNKHYILYTTVAEFLYSNIPFNNHSVAKKEIENYCAFDILSPDDYVGIIAYSSSVNRAVNSCKMYRHFKLTECNSAYITPENSTNIFLKDVFDYCQNNIIDEHEYQKTTNLLKNPETAKLGLLKMNSLNPKKCFIELICSLGAVGTNAPTDIYPLLKEAYEIRTASYYQIDNRPKMYKLHIGDLSLEDLEKIGDLYQSPQLDNLSDSYAYKFTPKKNVIF